MTEEEQIEAYLNGKMDTNEIEVFERKMELDPILKKQVGMDKEIMQFLNPDDWGISNSQNPNDAVKKYEDFLKSEKGKEIRANLKAGEQEYFKKKSSNPVRKIVIYAGSIAALLCIVLFSVFLNSKEPDYASLYQEHKNWEDLPSFTTKSAETNALSKAEGYFNQKNYREALPLFEQFDDATTNDPDLISLYIAISQIETNQNKKAIDKLNTLTSHWKYGMRARWYLALVYLKMDTPEKSILQLEEIVKDPKNYNYRDAQKLLKKLK